MISYVTAFNLVIFILFTICFAYQFVYVFVTFTVKKEKPVARNDHRYAVVISGRNEEAVIGQLVDSINKQDYPSELVDIFVIADNCTDSTAEVAATHGATVFERFNQKEVGKSYALDYGFKRIFKEYNDRGYEGYFVFDADNVLDKNFIKEMNASFDNGDRILTSYRNSKNYDSNWISAGYALWFLREAKYLNNARNKLGTSCAISGTGFLIAADILESKGGWNYHLLTEDIEFSVDSVLSGERIGYCHDAILYDEQPITFKASWNQRLRWSKGFYQVFGNYGPDLIKGIFNKKRLGGWACYDMTVTIAPAILLTLASIVVNSFFMIVGFIDPTKAGTILLNTSLQAVTGCVMVLYIILFCFGLLTMITERKRIFCPLPKRIFYLFTFPLFMFTYAPIAITALFKKVEWRPITHTVTRSVQEIEDSKDDKALPMVD